MDIGSFILDVQYSPWFVGPMGDAQRAVLEGGNITLMCATSVNGNPTPTISWMDDNGTTVSDGTGISGSTSLSLTITSITHYQAGNWTCTAENSPGGGTPCSVQRQIMMRVVVPPSQPRHGMTSVIHHISSQTEHPPHKKCGTDGVNLTCYLVKTHFGIFEREEDRES